MGKEQLVTIQFIPLADIGRSHYSLRRNISSIDNDSRLSESRRIGTVNKVIDFFTQREYGLNGTKPLSDVEQLKTRLTELALGRRVPVVFFNCIEFKWEKDHGGYPKAYVLAERQQSIAGFYKPQITEIIDQLKKVGIPDVMIVVPDSELHDTKVFNFGQTQGERKEIAEKIRTGLKEEFSDLVAKGDVRVILWSEYCFEYGFQPAEFYSLQQEEKILNDGKLRKSAQKHDSRNYFIRHGLPAEYVNSISQEQIDKRNIAYFAMYAGEGYVLQESRAISIIIEPDERVPAWYKRGAENKLAIVTPVNPKLYTEYIKKTMVSLVNYDGSIFNKTKRHFQ